MPRRRYAPTTSRTGTVSLPSPLRAPLMGGHFSSAVRRRRDALRRELARVDLHRAVRQRREHDTNGFARRVGPAERARRAGMAEGLLGTSGTARLLADAKSQPSRR